MRCEVNSVMGRNTLVVDLDESFANVEDGSFMGGWERMFPRYLLLLFALRCEKDSKYGGIGGTFDR